MKHIFSILMLILVTLSSGCGEQASVEPTVNLSGELANQMGDFMASIDDAGQGGNAIGFTELSPRATCGASTFGSCSSDAVIRTFGSCSIGGYTLTGTVTLTWPNGTNCALSTTGQSIRISPNYTIASNNVALTSTKTGTHGISLTWTAGTGTAKVFNFSNDGIKRTITYNGEEIFDITTTTTSNLIINGTTRGSRSLQNTGQIQVVNNLSSETCNFVPSNISWGSTSCNCANSGSWVGSCSSTGAVVVNITGCGTANVTYSEDGSTKQQTVSLDRCVQN